MLNSLGSGTVLSHAANNMRQISDVVVKRLVLTTFFIISTISAGAAQTRVRDGVVVGEQDMRVGRMRWPVRIIIARIDPRRFDISLQERTRANGMTGAWNVDSAGGDVAVAFNAGQFKETGPWGWLVMNGKELRNPGFGPLSVGIAIDSTLHFVTISQLQKVSSFPPRFGFQSYPVLLHDGRIAEQLLLSEHVDRAHRDARLILGQAADGSLLVVMTRYEGFGGVAERVPVGLTVLESAQLMKKLGARDAVMLDGGLSAQLLVRDSVGKPMVWKGLRDVPLALIFRPKPH